MSTLKVNTIQDTTGNDALTIDSSGNVTASQGFVPSTQLSHRNLIINGAMQVAQRSTSASAVNNNYVSLDRYMTSQSGGGTFTLSQETDTPSGQGFKNSMKVTVDTADSSIGTTDYYIIQHRIEGQNVPQLMLGTSDAVKVTLSFWVKSSLTGNFGGSLENNDVSRSYPFQYNISSANTWQKITKTIQLDTSGTWSTSNDIGLKIMLDFGSGTTYQGTADTWAGANYHTASSSVQLIGTANATWYITGLQLEVGSVATPFEHRSYGDELERCQRYYQKSYSDGTTPGTNTLTGYVIQTAWGDGGGNYYGTIFLKQNMRTSPTVTFYTHDGTSGYWKDGSSTNRTNVANQVSNSIISFLVTAIGVGTVTQAYGQYVADAEL